MTTSLLRRGICAVACTIVLGVAGAIPASAENDVLDGSTNLFVDSQSSTNQAARHLRGQAEHDAELLGRYAGATWFTDGKPGQVRGEVAGLVRRTDHTVPVLVAYNLPYRDCGQYSEGGAQSTAAYKAWIDGFAAGIGRSDAVVILEPDGLGLIPNYVSELDGSKNCTLVGLEATPAARFEQLNYAVDVLTALPNTAVYLDATHSGWQNVSESAFRLLKVDVEQTDGFYLNASNYQYTSNQVMYGTWVSACITAATTSSSWTGDPVGPLVSGFPDCPNQYWNGGPFPAKIADLLGEWTGVALSPYGVWSDASDDPALNTSGLNLIYAGRAPGTTHFVIDTGRNGQGPWDWAAAGYTSAGVAQDWCNPPDRGLGIPPTTDTGNPLVDAYLWIKVPGESDGSCTRDGSTGDMDPERGIIDPAAGAWFPQQARELIEFANPDLALPGNHHHHNA